MLMTHDLSTNKILYHGKPDLVAYIQCGTWSKSYLSERYKSVYIGSELGAL